MNARRLGFRAALTGSLLLATALSVGAAPGDQLCAKRSGKLAVREVCKKRETSVDPGDLVLCAQRSGTAVVRAGDCGRTGTLADSAPFEAPYASGLCAAASGRVVSRPDCRSTESFVDSSHLVLCAHRSGALYVRGPSGCRSSEEAFRSLGNGGDTAEDEVVIDDVASPSPVGGAQRPSTDGADGYLPMSGPMSDHAYAEGYLLKVQPEGIPVVVRTINLCMARETSCGGDRGNRVRGIAQLLHASTDGDDRITDPIGIIGVDEGAEDDGMTCRLFSDELITPSACISAEMANLTGKGSSSYEDITGVIASSDWEQAQHINRWHLGVPGSCLTCNKPFGYWSEDKVMVERVLRHRIHRDLKVRVYSLKFNGGGNSEDFTKRDRQADKVLRIIKSQVRPGELPPILLGDFNHWRPICDDGSWGCEDRAWNDMPDKSVRKLEEYFWRPRDEYAELVDYASSDIPYKQTPNIDIVYVGKPEMFDSRSTFEVLDHLRVDLQSEKAPAVREATKAGCGAIQLHWKGAAIAPQSLTSDDLRLEIGGIPLDPAYIEVDHHGDEGVTDVLFPTDCTSIAAILKEPSLHIEVGPNVEDGRGFSMDQNRDRFSSGAAEDTFVQHFDGELDLSHLIGHHLPDEVFPPYVIDDAIATFLPGTTVPVDDEIIIGPVGGDDFVLAPGGGDDFILAPGGGDDFVLAPGGNDILIGPAAGGGLFGSSLFSLR